MVVYLHRSPSYPFLSSNRLASMPQVYSIPTLELEHGGVLHDAPVAYQTWGQLSETADNAVLICHALTGNTDVTDWWGGLVGPGKVFDTDRFFIISANVLGSPYGSASPLTVNPQTGKPYGAAFPAITIRDTVQAHKAVLDHLGVQRLAVAAGGSMGGMQVLEWAFFGDFVQTLIPVACGGQHSAWCIGWGEAQRQAIYADPLWQDGTYAPDQPPRAGLAAARMMAMISYRNQNEFHSRFGRARMEAEGESFSVESYLLYQGQKLVDRFDANCYVSITKQMDTHDVSRGRGTYPEVLASIQQPTLVLGIDTDILYPLSEQEELAAHIPNAELGVMKAPFGHDTFLIDFEQLDAFIRPWLNKHLAPSPCYTEEVCP